MADLIEKDYLEEARSRITWQFRESDNLDTLLRIWLNGYQEIQNTLLQVQLINDVDIAQGKQLDVIGDIVGQPRELVNVSSTGYFGFLEDPGAKSFGSLKNSSGGVYYSVSDPESGTIELADTLYRLFVKAKIRNNNAGGTPEEVIAATKDLFQTDTVELLEGDPDNLEGAVFSLAIGREWNDDVLTVFPGLDETVIADRLLPKPSGVRIIYVDVLVIPTLEAVNNWEVAASGLDSLANTTFEENLG